MKAPSSLSSWCCWRLPPARPAPPIAPFIPIPRQASADLAAALKTAARTHRRILLDFGGNWCGDCQVLNLYFHDARNKPILEANFVLVDINIGYMDTNLDIAEQVRRSRQEWAFPRWPCSASTACCFTARRSPVQRHAHHAILGGHRIPGEMASRPRRLLGDGGELLRKAELAELAVLAGLARLSAPEGRSNSALEFQASTEPISHNTPSSTPFTFDRYSSPDAQ